MSTRQGEEDGILKERNISRFQQSKEISNAKQCTEEAKDLREI